MAAFPGLVFTIPNSRNIATGRTVGTRRALQSESIPNNNYRQGIRTFTLTFGDQAENHVGMQKIGALTENGFTCDDLYNIYREQSKNGKQCELINLNDYLPNDIKGDSASVLIIRNGSTALSRGIDNADDLFEEMAALQMDTKAKMYGRVVNKRARYNLCFDTEAQEPNYEEGKGRIVAYSSVPLLNEIRTNLPQLFGPKAQDLVVELNDYYDINKCGIGFHGDAERRRVIGLRLGATVPLHYQWFLNRKPIGERAILQLNSGDIYVMSEKAVGFDWKRSSQLTLRHAAGCSKYTTIK